MQLSDALGWLNSHNVVDGNKTEIRNLDVTIHDTEITDSVSSTALSKSGVKAVQLKNYKYL